MRKSYFVFLFLLTQLTVAQSVNSFVPKNWELIYKTSGDLNNDSIEDAAIIIEEKSLSNYKANKALGVDTLNLNPRTLLILFGIGKDKFRLADKNSSNFIPGENSEEIPCLEDPLAESKGIEIKNGVLFIQFNYWSSCGSWYTNDCKYTFRFQDNEFKLIGFDISSRHRSTGSEESTSINFLTKKKISTTGGNAFNEENNNPNSKKSKLEIKDLVKLRECNNETYEKMQNL